MRRAAQPRRVAGAADTPREPEGQPERDRQGEHEGRARERRQRREGERDAVEEQQDEQAHERGQVGALGRVDDDACGREERDHRQHLHEALRRQRVERGRRQEGEQQGDRVRALEQPRRPRRLLRAGQTLPRTRREAAQDDHEDDRHERLHGERTCIARGVLARAPVERENLLRDARQLAAELGAEAALPERRAVANEEARALGDRRRLQLLECVLDGGAAIDQTVAHGEHARLPGPQARHGFVEGLDGALHAPRHHVPRRGRLGPATGLGPDAPRLRELVEDLCYALRLGRELVLPAAERGRGALELASHVLDGRERGLLRNRGGRPLEQCVEIGAQRGDPCLDLLEGRLCRRVGPRRVQPAAQRVGPVGHLFGADPPNRRAVSGGWLRLGMTRTLDHAQREKEQMEPPCRGEPFHSSRDGPQAQTEK